MIINTAIGEEINSDVFQAKINQVIQEDDKINCDCQTYCYKENNRLIIVLEKSCFPCLENIVQLIINQIAEDKITDHFLICEQNSVDNIYYDSEKPLEKSYHNLSYSEDNPNISLENNPPLPYKSANFSVSFIVFILGIISLVTIGVSYYFSRPCVLGECTLLTETNESVSNILNTGLKADLTEEEIKTLIKKIAVNIQELRRIPPWANSHSQAQSLITQYQNNINDLDKLIQSSKLADDGINMTQQLPLSGEEWQRVENFWLIAIALIKEIKSPELESLKELRMREYQEKLELVSQGKQREEIAEKRLENIKEIAQQIKGIETQIKSLTDLAQLEQQWQIIIIELESMSPETTSYKQKDKLINEYLISLSTLQQKKNLEEKAIELKDSITEKINEAETQEKNNQWSSAVSLWNEALSMIEKFPSDSWLTAQINDLKGDTNQKLEQAKKQLKEAIKKQEIKGDLKKICTQTEKICDYEVSSNNVKIYLNSEYLKKVKSLSNLSNLSDNSKKQELLNHIQQVEKNYQYISSKYNLPVEVYNPEKELMIVYNNQGSRMN